MTRFLRHRSEYRIEPALAAKERAFLPHRSRDDAPLATSTFMIGKLRTDDVWRFGKYRLRDVKLRGRADFLAEQVTAIGLRLDADSRFGRHVDVVGWADQKAGQKLQAQKLARTSRTHLAPPLNTAGDRPRNERANTW